MCRTTIRWPTRSLKFWPGYLHLSLRYGTATFKPVVLARWETGFYKLKNIGIGLVVSVRLNLVVQLCFATEVQGSARPTLGNGKHIKGKEGMLMYYTVSSLVIDTLCKKDMERNASIACFYFDFAAPEEQSAAAVLGLVLKQIVRGLNEVPERIVKAFRDRDRFIGGQWLELAEIVQFLQDMSSSRSTFICIDALDECPLAYRVNLLDSLYQILQNSPGARVFLTGRPHILDEVDRHLSGRVTKRSITPNRKDIIVFLRAKLKEDTIPDAMDKSLEKEIMENIPETASEV